MSSIESNLQTHNTTTTTLHHTQWVTQSQGPWAPRAGPSPRHSLRLPRHHGDHQPPTIQDNNRLWHSVPSDGNLFSPFPLRHNIALLWALALALASIFAIAMSKRNDFYSSSRRLFQLSARARASINPIDSITVSATVSS
ncbi:hypothetical protein CSPX01_11182 [Colletotrichum filicis]|nr:hypothetical protein CSPX01_11182 [Colletotrichum filicis]